MLWACYRGWLGNDADGVLAAMKECFSYGSWKPDRQTDWLWASPHAKLLPPRDWPQPMAVIGPQLLDWLYLRTENRYQACCYQAYLDGAGTGWHYDADWPLQATISLGCTRTFGIRPRGEGKSFTIPLKHGDLMVMQEGFQDRFEHNLIEEDVKGERVSLVFRSPSA